MLDLSAFFVVFLWIYLMWILTHSYCCRLFYIYYTHAAHTLKHIHAIREFVQSNVFHTSLLHSLTFFSSLFQQKNHFFVCVLELTQSDIEQIQKPMNREHRIQYRTHGDSAKIFASFVLSINKLWQFSSSARPNFSSPVFYIFTDFSSIFDECMCAPRNRRNDLWFRQNKIKIQATIPWHSIDFRASTRHKTKVNPFNGCRYIAPTVTKKKHWTFDRYSVNSSHLTS